MIEAPEFHEEEALGKVYDARLMRRLLGYVRPYWGMVTGAVALIIVSSMLQLVGPLVMGVTLDIFIKPFEDSLPPFCQRFEAPLCQMVEEDKSDLPPFCQRFEAPLCQMVEEDKSSQAPISQMVEGWLERAGLDLDPMAGVSLMAALFAGTLLLTFVVVLCQGYMMNLMGQYIMFDLRRDIFARLQRLPVSYFDRNPIGRLVTRATTDVAALNELFTAGLVSIFGDIFMLAGIISVLFVLNWRLALVSFSVLPLLLALTLWFKIRARRSYRQVRIWIARINAFLQEHITGMSVVQLFNRERQAFGEFSDINAAHRDATVRAIFYYAVYYPMVELITALGMALIVWFGGGQVIRGALSIGVLFIFLNLAQRFYQPLADLSEKYNILQAAMASSERIFALIDTEVTIVSPADAYRPAEVQGAIEFEGVDFAYNPQEPVLEDISFRVEPGETIAVVGHTGAGKSTLANLLLRFYDVDSGGLRIDGVDVRQWDLESLRRSIALVLQDVFLFAGNVADNIRLGDETIDDERLRWAAGEVHALDFIERLPQGFDSEVRERGAGLSVGQKQLLAFARALAFDPRILILDEATASIDTETEQRIQMALERLLENRTSVVIAHRLSTIQKADRILVLHKGRLREHGTHQELLAERGIYHKLYLLQYREEGAALPLG